MDAIPAEAGYVILGIALGAGFYLALDWLFSWHRSLGYSKARDTVHRWWHSGLAKAPASIKIRNRDGTISDMRPIRASGLHLVVEPMVPGKQRTWEMVSVGQAEDADEFWRVWKYYGGKMSGWVDEDGDEFVPGS